VCGVLSGLLSLFLLSLSLDLLLYSNFSFGEFFKNLVFGSGITLEPWVSEDLTDGRSVIRIQLHASLNDLSEFFREEIFASLLSLTMGSPEDVSSAGSHASVEWILGLGSGEWRMTSDHNK